MVLTLKYVEEYHVDGILNTPDGKRAGVRSTATLAPVM